MFREEEGLSTTLNHMQAKLAPHKELIRFITLQLNNPPKILLGTWLRKAVNLTKKVVANIKEIKSHKKALPVEMEKIMNEHLFMMSKKAVEARRLAQIFLRQLIIQQFHHICQVTKINRIIM